MPNPPPNEHPSSIKSREGTLSKDELIDLLDRSREECVKLSRDALHQTIPVLLFLEEALGQDDPIDLVMHMKDRDVQYGHSGFAVTKILRWLSADLFECWNEIDKSDIAIPMDIRRLLARHPKAASSR